MVYHCVKFDLIHPSCLLVTVDTQFVCVKPLTFYCDLDLGRGNLNFVRDAPSHSALPYLSLKLDLIPFTGV